jgi:hypothetical protein
MAVSMVLMSERLEKRPGATPATIPPPILLEQPLFLCFVFLHRFLSGTPREVFIEVFLGQAERQETNMDKIGGSRPKRTWVARPRPRPTPPGLV